VSSEKIFVGFLGVPLIVVPFASESSLLMNILHSIEVFLIINPSGLGMGDEKSIMSISGRMSLGLEKRIEVPERAFHVSSGFHFLESHFTQDLDELLLSFHQQVEVSILDIESLGLRIELLEFLLLP
jgi:hypothetical protein